jgi:hypothetical protein
LYGRLRLNRRAVKPKKKKTLKRYKNTQFGPIDRANPYLWTISGSGDRDWLYGMGQTE